MRQRGRGLPPQQLPLLLTALVGCAPSVDVLGVYFPGWLVSAIAGVVLAYALVAWLARRPRSQELAESGLFFVGLVASFALTIWWVCFRGY